MSLIELNNLYFQYNKSHQFNLSIKYMSIRASDHIFIEGPSGCGKTTFLNLLTGLLKPSKGSIRILGTDITTLSKVKGDQFRADHFGIIFQMFNLIPYLNIIDNILLPCTFSKHKKENALKTSSSLEKEAQRLCKALDIESLHLNSPVQTLSIGQQQRIAIARALIGEPEIIIADEPTSALDPKRKQQFMNVLLNECQKNKTCLIFVSHDTSLKPLFKETYALNHINAPTTYAHGTA